MKRLLKLRNELLNCQSLSKPSRTGRETTTSVVKLRSELIQEASKREFYNDSKSDNPDALFDNF